MAPGCAGGDFKVGRELSDHFWLVSDQTVGQSWLNLNMGSRKGLTAKNRIRIRRSVIFSLSFHQKSRKKYFFQMSESEDEDNFGANNTSFLAVKFPFRSFQTHCRSRKSQNLLLFSIPSLKKRMILQLFPIRLLLYLLVILSVNVFCVLQGEMEQNSLQ